MISKPMHEIEIDHDWREVSRVDFGTSSEIATMRCADCGAENQVLHLESSEKMHENLESREEQIAYLKRTNIQFKQLGETIDLKFRESLNGTRYPTKEDLRYYFTERYIGNIKFENTPFGWLKLWTTRHTRTRQRKILLFCKQGPVCNRCDLIFSFDELTEDHINHDKNCGQLTDLQLLCKNCNGKKGNDPPTELDISPFKFEGESCIHRVACTELDAV